MNATAFDPKTQIHEELDAGDYAVVFRRGSDYELATDHDHIDEAFAEGRGRVIFHRPGHIFVRPSVLGGRFKETSDGAMIELDGMSVSLTDIEDGPTGVLLAALADDSLHALEVATHPSVAATNGGPKGITVVHGFRFWSHIAWFADLADAGPWDDVTLSDGTTLKGFSKADRDLAKRLSMNSPGDVDDQSAVIGLIDNGVDPQHPWIKGSLDDRTNGDSGDPNLGVARRGAQTDEHSVHGTMVAGAIRQTAPRSKIRSYDVTLPDRLKRGIADEALICNALRDFDANGVHLAVMAFGADLVDDDGVLAQAIATYCENGGNVYAAAGNIDPSEDAQRSPVYPAAYSRSHPTGVGLHGVSAVAGAPSGANQGPYYDWSNGDNEKTAKDSPWVSQSLVVTDDTRTDGFLFTSLGFALDATGNKLKDSERSYIPTIGKARGTSLLVGIAAGAGAAGFVPASQTPFFWRTM